MTPVDKKYRVYSTMYVHSGQRLNCGFARARRKGGVKKNRRANYFEAFRLGMKIQHATVRTLTEACRSLYIGLTGSRSALDTAQTDTLCLGFDRRPLEDLLVFDSAFRKSAPDISLIVAANHGHSDARFMAHGNSATRLVLTAKSLDGKKTRTGKAV